MSIVKLLINDTLYEGWLSVTIKQSIEQLSGTFSLTVTDRWSEDLEPQQIKPNDRCILSINEFIVITGFVDTVYIQRDANNHLITVAGRDKTCDLIDCSDISGTGQYKNLKLEAIATQLCKPFGIVVKALVDTGEVFATFNTEQGSSVYENLQKLCSNRGLLAMSDGLGNLLINSAGNKSIATPIVEGVNMLSGSAEYDYSYRFNEYICKGQLQGNPDLDVDSIVSNIAKVKDAEITRYRPLVVIYDGQATKANCETKATWEKATRRGRSRRFTIKVLSWLQPLSNTIWAPNQLITLNSKSLGVYDVLLIVGVSFELSDAGETTTLELTSPDAYLMEPVASVDATLNPYVEND